METNATGKRSVGQQQQQRKLRQLEGRLRQAQRQRDAYLEALNTNGGRKESQKPLLQMPNNIPRRKSRSAAAPSKRNPQKAQQRSNDGVTTKQFSQRFASAEGRTPPNLAGREFRPTAELTSEAEELLRTMPSLLSRLETSALFWETPAAGPGPSLSAGPRNYGLLLDSDLPGMEAELAAIRQSLVQLRQFRLNQPSTEYFQFPQSSQHFPPTISRLSFSRQLLGKTARQSELPSIAQIRARLLNMEFNMEHRIRELILERQKSSSLHSNGQFGTSALPQSFLKNGMNSMPTAEGKRPNVHYQPVIQNAFEDTRQIIVSSAGLRPTPMSPAERQQHIIEAPLTANDQPKQPLVVNAAKNTPSVEIQTPAFEPIRPILFAEVKNERQQEEKPVAATTTNSQLDKQSAAVTSPPLTIQQKEMTKDLTIVQPATQSQDEVNFERMLQVLKNPRRFELSSSTSDDEQPSKPRQQQPKSPGDKQELQAPPTATAAMTMTMKAPAKMANQMFSQEKGRANEDSDSDFFK